MSIQKKIAWIVCALLLAAVFAGCSSIFGGADKPTNTPMPTVALEKTGAPTKVKVDMDALYTQAAGTIAAEMTLNAPPTDGPAAPAPPTATPTKKPKKPTKTSPPTSTPLPTDTPPPTNRPTREVTPTFTEIPQAAYTLVFEDDFSVNTYWPKEYGMDADMHWGLGGYIIKNKVVNDIVWSVRSEPYANVRVEAIGQTMLGHGRREDYYGVVCHFGNGSNYYALLVANDGSYGIARQLEGALEFLVWEQDTTGTVQTLGGKNHVRADCLGTKLILYINDLKMAEVEDLTFTAGMVGLAVGTRDLAGHQVKFTYFAVYVQE